jgi:hypothetical protein
MVAFNISSRLFLSDLFDTLIYYLLVVVIATTIAAKAIIIFMVIQNVLFVTHL